MIIVSQDKNIVVNFENVANINIEKCYNESTREENFTFDILVFIVSSGLVRIGKYKTEERAKEVLQEIVKQYKNLITSYKKGRSDYPIETLMFNRNVYEMPVEKVDDK